jgi:hypothetical protein
MRRVAAAARVPAFTAAVSAFAAAVLLVLACLGMVACGNDSSSPGGAGGATIPSASVGADASDTTPGSPTRVVFIHHSTGENWLADDNGGLGKALAAAGYTVSDTNYGWGPGAIGDRTDIGNWWEWFRGPDGETIMAAVYTENGQNCAYTRVEPATAAGENEIVMFKSCFPNSALRGSPNDPIPSIADNPLKGVDSGSEQHTVANAKGIYEDLLAYFSDHPDKLFIVVTAPPLSDQTYAANARTFNDWLLDDWLDIYEGANVAVFDLYGVLTEGGPYFSAEGDDHPSQAGNRKATDAFVPWLEQAVARWRAGT